MTMARAAAVIGWVAVACIPALAAAPAMTAKEGRAYLGDKGIDPVPDAYPTVILDGDPKAVDAMIAAGVDVNSKTSLPQSPLELAAMSCSGDRTPPAVSARIVDSLIRAGADPNAPGIQGLGPLMVAAQQCDGMVVKRIIDAGAKLDSRTPQGFTPLSMALIVKNYSAAEVLIDAGARIGKDTGAKLTDGVTDEKLKAVVARAVGG